MKLIDAEELKQKILSAPVWTGLDMLSRINTMPTIDIVRCGECKHWDTADGECYGLDGVHFSKADDYCSYGERREP